MIPGIYAIDKTHQGGSSHSRSASKGDATNIEREAGARQRGAKLVPGRGTPEVEKQLWNI
jgi:hypothetical protein